MKQSDTQPGSNQQKSVIFVCSSNLIRSPYAAARFAVLFPTVCVDSAGSYAGELAREVPPRFIAAAARRGIDLGTHRSRTVNREDIRSAEALIALDEDSYEYLCTVEPAPTPPLRFVQYVGDISYTSIADPLLHGADPEETFDVIDRGVAAFAERFTLR